MKKTSCFKIPANSAALCQHRVQASGFVAFALFIMVTVSFGIFPAGAQTMMPPTKDHRVAIFAPLYLDSTFNGSMLKNSKSLPKLSMPAVDFVQGAELAFDTMTLNGQRVVANIYDSKSYTQPISWLIKNGKLDNVDLIIGSVKEPDYSQLAQFALERKVPFISSTYPNDGGIKFNPYTVILNSTLKAHCEGIFSYLMQKHGTDNIYLFKKKNDNRIDDYFKAINTADGKPILKIKTIMLDSSVSTYGLRNLVDTTKPVVIIGASLDETFAFKLADACYPIQKNTPLVLIGMPNWDGFRSLAKKDAFKDFPIRYTSPHYDSRNNSFTSYLSNSYFQLYRTKPNDMAFKGFESAWYFVNLLLNYGSEMMDHLNENTLSPFHDFNFRPVYNTKGSTEPDYFENKHLFIMQLLNGESLREW